MLRSIRSLGAAHLRRRRGRAILAATGVVLGVAIFFAVQTAAAGVGKGFSGLIDDALGGADVTATPIGAAGATLPADTYAAAKLLPSVKTTAAALTVPAAREDGATLRLIGVEGAATSLFQFPMAAGRLPAAGGRELLATEGKGYTVGQTVGVQTPTGTHAFTVVGLMHDKAIAQLGRGNTVYTSLQAAQTEDGRGPVVDDIRIALDKGTTVKTWVDQHKFDLSGAELFEAKGRFGNVLGLLSTSLSAFSMICLFLGGFLIYVTLSGAVLERTNEYGLLLALGADPKQVRRSVTSEALALGGVACIAGLVLGLVMGLGLTKFFSALVNLDHVPFVVPPGAVIAVVVLTLATCAIAAIGPSRRASKTSPTEAMRGDLQFRAPVSRWWPVGGVLFALGLLVQFAKGSMSTFGLGTILVLAGAVMLVPPLVEPVGRLVGGITARLSRGAGDVAVSHLVREKGRVAHTIALVMAVLAVGMQFGITLASYHRVLDRTLQDQFGADLQVQSPNPMPPGTAALVKGTPGVTAVSEERFGSAVIDRSSGTVRYNLFILDPSTYFDVTGFAWEKGITNGSARQVLTEGGSVFLPKAMASRLDLKVGSAVPIHTTQGVKPFKVAGFFTASGGWNYSVVAGLPDGQKFFGTGAPIGLIAKVGAGVNVVSVRDHLKAALQQTTAKGRDPHFTVTDAAELKRFLNTAYSRQLAVFNILVWVAILVGLLGLANTLVMSVLRRRREIGVFRAVGAKSRQIAATVVVEALTLVGVAFVLAIPLGLLLGVAVVHNSQQATGMQASFVYPIAVLIQFAVITVGLAVASSVLPARRASRLTVVDSLRLD